MAKPKLVSFPEDSTNVGLFALVLGEFVLGDQPRRNTYRGAAEGGLASEVEAMNRQMMGRGSIAFFATYRPPVPLDIFSCPVPPSSARDEVHLTDGVSYNYNCHSIPPPALKDLLSFLGERNRKLAAECGATAAHVHAGQVMGLVFISERSDGLETLYLALRFNSINRVKVLSLAEIYGPAAFSGTRMEDTGGIGGGFMVGARIVDHSLIYVSTKEPVESRRSPWTKVYRTNLRTGETESLTPSGQYDLSPAVSPSGKLVAVASFAGNKWRGEIENLRTNIYVMNVDTKAQGGLKRSASPLIQNGGWPTWGSDNVIFFHRGADTTLPNGTVQTAWGVFRYDITTKQTVRVTPPNFNCMTPAAISETKVAVATIRSKSGFGDVRVEAQYRHIEIFDTAAAGMVQHITLRTRPRADHYNPFVLDGGRRVGYHRCHSTRGASETDTTGIHRLQSPIKDVGLFRASGVFPTISRDGSKLAFVDNEFKSVWLADGQGLRVVYETKGPDSIFSPVWNQNPDKDILYVCMGPSFNAGKPLEICAIHNVSSGRGAQRFQLTKGMFNNAFPSSNPQGTKFVFRSTRDGGEKKHKNLYIMEKGDVGEYHDGTVTRLTNGPWTDTHCQWSPNGDWIVFSSTRDKPADKLGESDHGLDPGYFAVYLVNVSDGTVVRVIRSGIDLAGHVNHPVFSPDGRSIAVTADLAAVSVDPISLPLFVHSVRPYGDIFVVDIDPTNIKKNKDVKAFRRITHSRYENSTPCWTVLSPDDPRAQWTAIARRGFAAAMGCPYVGAGGGGESFHMTGHLIIPKRCC